MREIRFRGKRIDNGEWVYGYMIGNDVIVGEIVEFSDEYFNTEFWYKVDPETVGQYTGLKDRNGREIYEGDIVRFFFFDNVKELISPVEQVVECGTGHYIRLQGRGYFSLNPTVIDRNYVEVIGNTWEDGGMLDDRKDTKTY